MNLITHAVLFSHEQRRPETPTVVDRVHFATVSVIDRDTGEPLGCASRTDADCVRLAQWLAAKVDEFHDFAQKYQHAQENKHG